MKDIETLIPHRAPFLFVDEITTATSDKIVGNRTFDNSEQILKGSFPDFKFVPGMIIIESMAQCGGAGVKMLGITQGIFGLAYIENANFYNGVKFGDKVRYEIKNIRLSEKIIKQSGVAYVNEKPVADATWMCVRID
jgi:3-hydroxyacyl-[acyl-carrier-protein] dehydratase